MRRRPLFLKAFFLYFSVIVAASVLITSISFQYIKSLYINATKENLESMCETLKFNLAPFFANNEVEKIDTFVKDLGKRIDARITVIDIDGKVIGDSYEDPHLMDNHRFREEVQGALSSGYGSSIRYSKTLRQNMLYVAMPLEYRGGIIAIVRTSKYLKDINYPISDLRLKIIRASVFIILLSIITAYFISRGLSKPIEELIDVSKRVADGHFDVQVFSKDRGEVGELFNSFNYMISKIKELITELSLERDELNCVISSIEDGLLVIDSSGKIVAANRSFKTIVNEDDVENRYYWEVLRDEKFDDDLRKVLKERRNRSDEIDIEDRVYLCGISIVQPTDEVVAIFHDISEMRRLEEVKRDFVTNVSHELRTPLTAIKGFVETLLSEEDDDSKRRYLKIVGRHTERLINIVKDLLLLSRLEDRSEKVEIEEVDIGALVDNVLKVFSDKVEKKGLLIKREIEEGLPLLKGDQFKLEQMFINLIDNAIKYTETGSIRISASSSNHRMKIEIEDTGIGIPEKYVPRIFERFYVVDKSRSRRSGGTGLGLSIVKHIVLLHNGDIDVSSKVGVGTKFTITLPL